MPREKRTYVVCVPCWCLRAPQGHEPWQCADAKCVCCGFKAVEAAVKAQRIKGGA